MTPAAADFAPLRLATDDLPERDRLAIWREVVGRRIVRLDMAPIADHPFRSEIVLRSLPGLGIQWGFDTGIAMQRTRPLLADGNDDLILPLSHGGVSLVTQRGQEATLGPGNSVLMSCADVGAVTCHSLLWFTALKLPRKAMAPLVTGVEDMLMRPIPNGRGALRLLSGYVKVLQDDVALATPELRQLAVAHVYDLVALALGATGDAAAAAKGRGLRAARLREVLAAIKAGYADTGFGVEGVALALGLSPRYVQDLLHESGASFTERVLELRLQKARAMLADRRHDRLKVSDIAYECGFDGVSYFNRCFRRRFGASPTQYRGNSSAAD